MADTPRLCDHCGYLMTVNHAVDPEARPPGDGDISVCGGCGYPYRRNAGAWEAMTLTHLLTLSSAELHEIVELRLIVLNWRETQPVPEPKGKPS
jgi:hypothetical protein